jgi:hypothetical protein
VGTTPESNLGSKFTCSSNVSELFLEPGKHLELTTGTWFGSDAGAHHSGGRVDIPKIT